MGVAQIPAASGGGIKSVQRGLATGAGNVTITAVDINKSFVTVFGTTSSGTVAASAAVNAATGNIAATTGQVRINNQSPAETRANNLQTFNIDATSFTGNSTNLTGGTNNLVAAVVQGYLSTSTTLVVSGACRWEVVEFN